MESHFISDAEHLENCLVSIPAKGKLIGKQAVTHFVSERAVVSIPAKGKLIGKPRKTAYAFGTVSVSIPAKGKLIGKSSLLEPLQRKRFRYPNRHTSEKHKIFFKNLSIL